MLTTYDRYLREWREKCLKIKLQREDAKDESEVIPSVRIAQLMRHAVKQTMRNMEGQ